MLENEINRLEIKFKIHLLIIFVYYYKDIIENQGKKKILNIKKFKRYLSL